MTNNKPIALHVWHSPMPSNKRVRSYKLTLTDPENDWYTGDIHIGHRRCKVYAQRVDYNEDNPLGRLEVIFLLYRTKFRVRYSTKSRKRKPIKIPPICRLTDNQKRLINRFESHVLNEATCVIYALETPQPI